MQNSAFDLSVTIPEVERLEVVSCNGVQIPIIRGLFSEQIIDSIKSQRYEANEAAELRHLIQPGERILEIGAGCGFISTICALNEHTASVTAVEANPSLIPVIKLVHKLNAVNIDVFNEVLGDDEGLTDFYVHADYWASGIHSFLGKRIEVTKTEFQRRLAQVQPTMLVVDIEGGEFNLFDRANLQGVMKIMIEVHQNTIGRHGIKHMFDVLSAQGFHYDSYHSSHSVVTFSHVTRV